MRLLVWRPNPTPPSTHQPHAGKSPTRRPHQPSPTNTANRPNLAAREILASGLFPKQPPRCQSHQPAGTDPE